MENPEVREIIEMCIRLKKEERPLVKDLLNHEFFADDVGLKLEMVSRDTAVAETELSRVEFRLRVLDPKKRSNKHKENEAIQFDFDIQEDNAEEVASEMAKSSLILEEDAKAVAKMLKSQIAGLLREREERKVKEEKERQDREIECNSVDNILQNQLLLQQMQMQQQQVQSNLNVQIQNQVSIKQQMQVQGHSQQPQTQPSVQQSQQHNLSSQQVQLVQQQPLIQHQSSGAQTQPAPQLHTIPSSQYQQQQPQQQQQKQPQFQQQIFEGLGTSSSQCSTPQNLQVQPQFPHVSQHLQQQQLQQSQQYMQLNQISVSHPPQIQPQMSTQQQQIQQQQQNLHQQIPQNQQQMQFAQQVQHIQQIHQNQGASSTPGHGQTYYQNPSTATVYSSPSNYQQNIPQQIYHGYLSNTTSSTLVDVLPVQINQHIFTHSNSSITNSEVTTTAYIQPIQIQVTAVPASNVQNLETFAHVNTLQTSTAANIQSLSNTTSTNSHQSKPNSVLQLQLPTNTQSVPNTIIVLPTKTMNMEQQSQHEQHHTNYEIHGDCSILLNADAIDTGSALAVDINAISQYDTTVGLVGQHLLALNDGYVFYHYFLIY